MTLVGFGYLRQSETLRPHRITRLDAVGAAKWHTEFTVETPNFPH
jgi:hypothetical protein